jgi:hypothetical protein
LGPKRLVPGPPRKKAISMQPQAQSMKATAPSRAAIKAASQSCKYRLDPGATNNGTIHQPLLSRSCRRLIEVARKIQDEHGHAGEIGGQRDNVEQRKGCATQQHEDLIDSETDLYDLALKVSLSQRRPRPDRTVVACSGQDQDAERHHQANERHPAAQNEKRQPELGAVDAAVERRGFN